MFQSLKMQNTPMDFHVMEDKGPHCYDPSRNYHLLSSDPV